MPGQGKSKLMKKVFQWTGRAKDFPLCTREGRVLLSLGGCVRKASVRLESIPWAVHFMISFSACTQVVGVLKHETESQHYILMGVSCVQDF